MGILTNNDLYVNKFDPTSDINPKTVGAVWFNYDTGKYFVCKDNTKEKNVWIDFMGELEKRIEEQINKAIAAMGTVDAKIAQAIKNHEEKPSGVIESTYEIERYYSSSWIDRGWKERKWYTYKSYSGHINTVNMRSLNSNQYANQGMYILIGRDNDTVYVPRNDNTGQDSGGS